MGIVTVIGLLSGWSSLAQDRVTPIPVNANQASDAAAIKLEMTRLGEQRAGGTGNEYRLGEKVKVCFVATADGYVTLWDRRKTEPQPALIYPNKYSHAGEKARAEKVKANERICVGDSGKFHLQMMHPLGPGEVYLHWTAREGDQFEQSDYPVIGAKPTAGSKSVPPAYASNTLAYVVKGN